MKLLSQLCLDIMNDGPLEVKTTQRVMIGGVREKGKMIKNDQIENDQPIAIEETGI